jgi:hypothetical protein
MDGPDVLPVCGLIESGERSLTRSDLRAGVLRDDVLEPAVRFEAYDLAALVVKEYARAEVAPRSR